ncbi:hypothetical protein KY285_016812 [Solanum tuberosum]|nr:hypothetical protein KY284_016810 [Solanum tuberosum]KAH0689660.1 hypothetical protein KY289_017018 [Solanum tuberosum]KAH0702534.1 hypothetical protein KY285_016812 [Solanum tuberosum]
MGRMHSRGKGISASALPYKRTPPSWLKISAPDVEDNICKFAKKGLTPSQIGVILRDSHGIAQVKSVTGSKILRILKAHGLAPEIPEDLYHLIKKAVAIRKHLERNRKDKDSKFRLILVESRIHRLARYYKKTKKLPPVWKYALQIVCIVDSVKIAGVVWFHFVKHSHTGSENELLPAHMVISKMNCEDSCANLQLAWDRAMVVNLLLLFASLFLIYAPL